MKSSQQELNSLVTEVQTKLKLRFRHKLSSELSSENLRKLNKN